MLVTIDFEVEKQTKNTIRFQEKSNTLGPAPVVGTLYVQKWAVAELAKGQNVEALKLRVTVEVVK